MFSKATLLALAAASAVQAAAPQGFNYGAKMGDTPRNYDSFKTDFEAAQKLQGAPGTFNAARLYTMLDAADGKSVIPALKAAMDTKTYLLLGLWMSSAKPNDFETFDKEIKALSDAVKMDGLAQYILGISVGSEDLYRISPTGLAAPDAAPGNTPDMIVQYIQKVRDTIKGGSWAKVPVGHVDTWTAWVNGSNSAVIDNSDFLGVDAYPYWQNTQDNGVSNGASLFNEAMDNTRGVSNGKPVWITETGWAVTGPTEGKAVAGTAQAQQYWDDVACPNLGNTPTFWYTLYDGVANSTQTPSFSVANQDYQPAFDLSCSGHTSSNSTGTSGSSSSGSSTGSASMSTGTGSSSSGSGASNGTYTGAPSQPSSTGGSSSGSGSSSSGSGSGSGSGSSSSGAGSSSSGTSSNGSSISTTNAARSLSISLGSAAAIAAAVVAFL